MKYTLDIATWRCGELNNRKGFYCGDGPTFLLNSAGYSCCLGQFAAQMGVEPGCLMECSRPSGVVTAQLFTKGGSYDPAFFDGTTNTELAVKCIGINDDRNTTVHEKVKQLTAVLAAAGHELEIINAHLIPEPPDWAI